MSDREIAWTPERQDTLQAAENGELHWFNPGGLGGAYIRRESYVFGPDNRHPVKPLVLANALEHGKHVMVGHQGRRLVCLTAYGRNLLAKWRARRG